MIPPSGDDGVEPPRVRVTYLVDSPNLGGAEMTVLQLVAAPDVEATVVSAEPTSDRFLARAGEHARVIRVPPVGRRWEAVPRLVSAIAATSPDVVHANLIDPTSNAVLLAAAVRHPAPAVATCHMIGQLGAAGSRQNLAAIYRRLDHVIAVSDEIAAMLRRELAVRDDRIGVVANGVDLDRPRASPAGDGTVRLGTVARLTPQKGIDVLIEALAELRRRDHPVELLIAGTGRDRTALGTTADALPVTFLGHVEDVPALLATLDVFCLASRAEGLPLALLEAMAAGLPCIATDVGDVRRAVSDAAIVVPPDDVAALTAALEGLVLDPDERTRLGARARARAERCCDVRWTTSTTTSIYRRLVAGAGARSTGANGG